MKKIGVILLAFCLVFAFFTGCGGGGDESGDIVMTLIGGSAPQPDIDVVEAEVSRISKEKLGFGVKFKFASVFELSQLYLNWLAAGEEIDLIGLFFVDTLTYINNKSVREIDSLISEENTPHLLEIFERTGGAIKNMGFDGKTYGLTVVPAAGMGRGTAYTVRKDILEQAGLYGTGEGQYVDQQKIDYDDLDRIFAAIKQHSGTTPVTNLPVYPVGNLINVDVSYYLMNVDVLGHGGYTYPSGGLIGTDSTTVVNVYKSDIYKQFVNKMGEWKANGYVHPDADSTSITGDNLFKTGQFVGCFLDFFDSMRDQYEKNYGYEFVQLIFVEPFYTFSNPNGGWHIPSKSKRPVKAIKFLDLMFSDVEVMNTLQYGVLGVHREWADYDAKILRFPEGVNMDNTRYKNMPGLYGDYGLLGSWMTEGIPLEQAIAEKNAIIEADTAKTQAALANPSKGLGFTYNPKSQQARIMNINNVIDKYAKTLSIGKGSKGTDGTWTGPNSNI